MAPLFFSLVIVLLLFFLPSSISEEGDLPQFWSIDCGGSESFVDYKNVTWVTDAGFVQSGENRSVEDPTTNTPRELQTLRVFKYSKGTLKETKKKYCYTIPVARDTKVLLRAWFNYGNYDGRGIAPEFDVLYDGNLWTTVKTSVDETRWIEIIYVTKRLNGTSMCFVRTSSDQDPFVSSIEVRTLKPDMYGDDEIDSNLSLLTVERLAFGADKTKIIRYPDDIYDRVWYPYTLDGCIPLTNNATFVNTTHLTNRPPQLLFHSAIAPMDEFSNITISNIPGLEPELDDVYYKMYFTEMRNLTAEKASRRSFFFYVDGELYDDDPIEPEYAIAFQLSSDQSQASNNTKFDLQRADDSTLRPIISGFEFYLIYEVNQVTLEDDVQALSALQEHFKLLQEWTGDPCLPEKYNWEWVVCAYFTSPRIIALNLSGYGFIGTLPDFSGLNFLKIIDLSNNSFTGDIPEFLAKLPKLEYLNLANNDFGSIPTSLRDNTTIELYISGNPKLKNALSPPPSTTNGDMKVEVPKISTVINIIIFFAAVLVYHV